MGKNRLKQTNKKKTLVFSVHLETYLLQYMEGHTFFGSSSISEFNIERRTILLLRRGQIKMYQFLPFKPNFLSNSHPDG